MNACLQSLNVGFNQIGAEGAKGLGDALKVVDDVCM